MTRLLLLEGGVAGHMNHLYDNGDLTFGKLKEIFTAASNGELEGTEKTDGQNLYISYSVKEGKAKAARNKGNIKAGGMDAEALASNFKGRGDLTNAFVDAFATFERAVQSLDPKTQMKIFGPENEIYYNAEIMDPRTPNVISYDTKTLLIHQVGHGWYDKETGAKDEEKDVSDNVETLQAALKQMQEATAQDEYSVQVNAIRQLEALEDDLALNDAVQSIDSIMGAVGLNDENTVTEFMVARLMPTITQLPVDEETQKAVLKRLLKFDGALTLPQITKGLQPEVKQQITALAKDKTFLPGLIRPLEVVIHDFGVEMLRGLQSAFILDNEKEVKRLQAETAKAIAAIENSGNEEALQILRIHMEKLKGAEQYDTATEGFVFDYDGTTYKFTGNFAPANQLLGLFKYGRGKIPPMVKEEEKETADTLFEAPEQYDVAVYPGAFKPPHRAHLALVSELAKISKRVIILVSPLARLFPDGREMTFDMAYQMWKPYLKSAGLNNVKVLESPVNSPVGASFKFVANEDENPDWAQVGEKVVLASSTKGGDDSRFGDKVQKYAREGVEVFSKAVEVKGDAFVDTRTGDPLSASAMRDAIANRDLETFTEYLPKALRGDAENLLDKLTPPKKETVKETLFRIIEEMLDESSAMSSGQVDGYPGTFRKKQKKYAQDGWGGSHDVSSGTSGEILDDPHDEEGDPVKHQYVSQGKKKIKENGELTMQIDRNEFIQEMILRENIRKAITLVKKQKNKQAEEQLLAETKLRKTIRKLIEQEGDDGPAPHESTGINVLESLLKKIIPIIEEDYKQLTTNTEQRESYRAHVVNAIQDAIAPAKAIVSDTEIAEPDMEAPDELALEEIEFEVDDKEELSVDSSKEDEEQFIDIAGDEESEDTFGIKDKDTTGRNFAEMTFEKIETQIIDAYSILSDDNDRELFYDYLLANIKLYFDKFEDELATYLPEPTNPEYEDEKSAQELDAEEGAEAEAEEAGEEELGDEEEIEL